MPRPSAHPCPDRQAGGPPASPRGGARAVFGQFANLEGEIITGTVSRVEPRAIILDVGRSPIASTPSWPRPSSRPWSTTASASSQGLCPRGSPNDEGPQIHVSRTHKGFLRRLFELEVPEIHAGTVEIRAIAREAGSRSKVAVASRQEGLSIRSGPRSVSAAIACRRWSPSWVARKVDIIPWSDDPATLVANALSPAQVVGVRIDEELRIANVTVPERMLSLAIGREGQNARLAAKLTGWRIDIRSDVAASAEPAAPAVEPDVDEAPTRPSWLTPNQRSPRSSASRPGGCRVSQGPHSAGPEGPDGGGPEGSAKPVASAKPKRASRAAKATAPASDPTGPVEVAVGADASVEPVAAKPSAPAGHGRPGG